MTVTNPDLWKSLEPMGPPAPFEFEPTFHLRWRGGVLEQRWECEKVADSTHYIFREWRPVPTEAEDDTTD